MNKEKGTYSVGGVKKAFSFPSLFTLQIGLVHMGKMVKETKHHFTHIHQTKKGGKSTNVFTEKPDFSTKYMARFLASITVPQIRRQNSQLIAGTMFAEHSLAHRLASNIVPHSPTLRRRSADPLRRSPAAATHCIPIRHSAPLPTLCGDGRVAGRVRDTAEAVQYRRP